MAKLPVTIMNVILVVFLVVFPATPCRGSDRASTGPTITLDVQNKPLRSVLEEIAKTTGWKIKAPDKWMEKPITQTLNKVSMEEGLRFILKDAGVENLLLTYDENRKTITVYDTEIRQGQSADRPPAQGEPRPPVFSASDQPDPVLNRPAKDARSGSSRGAPRARDRRKASAEEE